MGSWLFMEHRKSLGYFITKYAIIELLYSLFIVILFYVCLHALINHEIIYPANYAEQQINTVQERFQQDQFNLSDIPYYYDYQYSIDGMVIESTFNNHLKQQMNHVFEKGYSGSTSFIGGTIFVPINKGNEELILAYHICSIPTNPNTYQYIHNFDLFYIICMFALWLIGFSILVHHSIKTIKKELTKIITVNSYIEDMNLDYKQVDSKFIEIHNVLDSLNTLSTNLRESLLKQ